MKGTVPSWLQPLLDLDPAESGEGTVWRLDYEWPWPAWATVLGLAALVALLAFSYLREAGSANRAVRIALLTVRLAVVGLLCFMIAQFALSLERTGLPYLVFAVDDSASMGIIDRYDDAQLESLAQRQIQGAGLENASRLNLAKSLLLAEDAGLLLDAARGHKVRLYFISDAARGEIGELSELPERIRQVGATGQNTRLGRGVREILNDLRRAPRRPSCCLATGLIPRGNRLRTRRRTPAAKACRCSPWAWETNVPIVI